jgi:hypothetical protein
MERQKGPDGPQADPTEEDETESRQFGKDFQLDPKGETLGHSSENQE